MQRGVAENSFEFDCPELGCHARLDMVLTLLDLPEPQESDDADHMRLESVAASFLERAAEQMALGSRMHDAGARLPAIDAVSGKEKDLVHDIEKEVDAAFGEDARLYGRAVALYCVRELLSLQEPRR